MILGDNTYLVINDWWYKRNFGWLGLGYCLQDLLRDFEVGMIDHQQTQASSFVCLHWLLLMHKVAADLHWILQITSLVSLHFFKVSPQSLNTAALLAVEKLFILPSRDSLISILSRYVLNIFLNLPDTNKLLPHLLLPAGFLKLISLFCFTSNFLNEPCKYCYLNLRYRRVM